MGNNKKKHKSSKNPPKNPPKKDVPTKVRNTNKDGKSEMENPNKTTKTENKKSFNLNAKIEIHHTDIGSNKIPKVEERAVSPAMKFSLQPQVMSVSSQSGLKANPRGSLRSYVARRIISEMKPKLQTELEKISTIKMEKKSSAGQLKVGIVGAGFAGLYAALMLQSVGIDIVLYESDERAGGRIKTWYSKSYDPSKKETAGLYGEVGGMRVPQYSLDMLPVKHLSLVVNEKLRDAYMTDFVVQWRKFHYSSKIQTVRFNNMRAPILASDIAKDDMGFSERQKGSVPDAWFTKYEDPQQPDKTFRPIDQIMNQIDAPFVNALKDSFETGFQKLMQFDRYSMWGYLTTVFTLGDLRQYYRPELGARTDLIPHSVAAFLETTMVGSNMFLVSFVEMVIADYDWNASKNPYEPTKDEIFMITVDGGMQRLAELLDGILQSQIYKGTRQG